MKYKLTFNTGTQSGSGTDADVSIILFGTKGQSKEIILNSQITGNAFEKGSSNSFVLSSDDLGKITKLKVWHNNKWLGADWFLDNILLEEDTTQELTYFSVGRWIKKDQKVEMKSTQHANYSVDITTGTLPGAGTNANVSLDIIGSKGSTNFFNVNSYIKSKDFITGYTESFTLPLKDIGQIKEVKVKSDSSGFNNNWFLNRIIISKQGQTKHSIFSFFNWIKPDTNYTLELGQKEYSINIHTGDVAHGGTDANVSMILFGSKRKSRIIKLNEYIARNAFEAGKVDYLKIVEKDLGHIEKINIWHDEKWLGDGWFLNKIVVKNDSSNSEAVFPFYSWLDKSVNPKSINIELTRMPLQPRPFYSIAHMLNTPAYVEEALDMGTNAIEFDITPKLNADGNFTFDVFHGFRPDFDPDKVNLMERSIARTDLTSYLKRLKEFEEKYNQFTLVIYDCKVDKVPKDKLTQCGEQLAKEMLTHFYQKKSPNTNRVKSIVSIGKKKSASFLTGVINKLPKKYAKFVGYDLSMENFKTTEEVFEKWKGNNFWWGSGIAAMVPKTLTHFVPQFLIAAKKRTTHGLIKKIYYWTLESPDSMERMLVTKLDGIIVNDPLKLLRVLGKEEFRNTYRLANRDDNPFEVF
ncbi:MAG: PLAT/LH2 domain-containing protein [Melioribacteraceae bacterium]